MAKEIVKAGEEVIGIEVQNTAGDTLGKICEIMLDKHTGQTVYAVLESDTFLGLGSKLFALPWEALDYNLDTESFILDIDSDTFKNAPGFDKEHWPDMADAAFGKTVTSFYKKPVYPE